MRPTEHDPSAVASQMAANSYDATASVFRHDAQAPLRDLASTILREVATVLKQDPSLASTFREVLAGASERQAHEVRTFMTVKEYAEHAKISERTVRGSVKTEMQEGVHFHRDGRKGRRIVIHVAEADGWRASRVFGRSQALSVDELATNEVLRRRAKHALEKGGVR